MSNYKVALSIWIFISTSTFGLTQTLKKVNVSNHIEMTGQIEEVWTIISNLKNLDQLVPEIVKTTKIVGNGKGSIITLTLKSSGKNVVEEVYKLDNKRYVMSYRMLKTPMPIDDYRATIKIISSGSTSYHIYFDAVFKVNEKNKETMKATIDNFQKTLLLNTKKIYNHEK